MKKKVFVSGCFDLLHSGHIAFLKEANNYGDVYVNIGNDINIKKLKGRYPVYSELERKFVLESIRFVKECKINIYISGKVVIITKDYELIKKIEKELSSILYPYIQSEKMQSEEK